MPEESSKYGWYYGKEAEELAKERLRLRKAGKFYEADLLRNMAKQFYGVEIQDTQDSYMLQWVDRG